MVPSVYFSFCLLASSVSNFRPDTRGQWWSLFQAYLFSRAAGREEHCKQISLACVGSAHSVSARLGLPPLTACMLSQSTLIRLQVALRGTGPGLCALPRSKPVRFRFLGTPQRCRLSWACVLCPSVIRAAQATRCLASALSPGGWYVLSPPHPSHWVSWVHSRCTISGMPCVSSGVLISGCGPPGRYQPSRIPGRLG